MNICKISWDNSPCKCHEYAYELKFHITDSEKNDKVLLEQKQYAVIDFKGITKGMMVVLPGDQVKVTLHVSNHQRKSIRLAPDINAIIHRNKQMMERYWTQGVRDYNKD